ncbi:hypothetical protein D2V93_02560 [Flagellimonas taeanensis]|nr:hypothetical protein D2V93_02560 [Allomuricauda taeanensis]
MRKNRKAFGMLSSSLQELKNLFFSSHKENLWDIHLKIINDYCFRGVQRGSTTVSFGGNGVVGVGAKSWNSGRDNTYFLRLRI